MSDVNSERCVAFPETLVTGIEAEGNGHDDYKCDTRHDDSA